MGNGAAQTMGGRTHQEIGGDANSNGEEDNTGIGD